MSQLPIHSIMPTLLESVARDSQIILQAEPGAGKSTYFPLRLLEEQMGSGKIIMLEPRRLAAKNIAQYLAIQLSEKVGQRVGYRIRGETCVSRDTQLEIVTEGVLTRMLQDDPELSGVAMIIWDEFHERSLHADLSLALALEVQSVFRDDLKLIVMSATLDADVLKSCLPDAAYHYCPGRQFPVDIEYHPCPSQQPWLVHAKNQIVAACQTASSSILVFLPGVAAITRLHDELVHALSEEWIVTPLYGQLDFAKQQTAILPSESHKKVVLATNIAETSLTIEGIGVVIDSGLERKSRFDLNSGVTRLEEAGISQASATQRSGRAGRLAHGKGIRLYTQSQFEQASLVSLPEVLVSDLSGVMFELANWGVEASTLNWVTEPPEAAQAQGKKLLISLGLLDINGTLTPSGRKAYSLGLEPRLAAMIVKMQQHSDPLYLDAAIAVSVIAEEDKSRTTDLGTILHWWQSGRHDQSKRLTLTAHQLAKRLSHSFSLSPLNEEHLAAALAAGYPDRVAQFKGGERGQSGNQSRYTLASGHGVYLDSQEALAGESYLVVLDAMRFHGQQSSRVRKACRISYQQLCSQFQEQIDNIEVVDWDERNERILAQSQRRLGALVLQSQPLANPDGEKLTQALLTYVAKKGLSVLNWGDKATALQVRVQCAKEWLPQTAWPNFSSKGLLNALDEWLAPFMLGVKNSRGLKSIDVLEALNAYLGWDKKTQLDQLLPNRLSLPSGNSAEIHYQLHKAPTVSVKLQEMFGEPVSPTVANGTQTIVLELLSPARRPLQITSDLAGFWRGAYKEVQKEMKGRYPKHPWPDNPEQHIATSKTKRQLKL